MLRRLFLCALLVACGDDDGGTDSGLEDAGPDATIRDDAGNPITCSGDGDCDDGIFCNGAEVCSEGECRAGTSACTPGQTCIEATDECRMPDPGDWVPPIGVPVPPFGIVETSGPYTHYVDNGAGCSDDDPFGTETTPRCSIPTDLPAGSVVEVHGGPYDYGDRDVRFTSAGTLDAPAFLRGVGMPTLQTDTWELAGSYLIVEGFHCEGCRLRMVDGPDHLVVRDSEIARHPRSNGVQLGGTDAVFLRNHVHHHQGDDRHGIFVASGSERVWIVDNDVHHNGGDGIQFCHGCDADPPEYVYIGRNDFHSDRENGVDLKYASHVIVSQNTIYGYRSAPAGEEWCFDDGSSCGVFSSGSDGSAVVVGSDGAPSDVWLLHNRIYDSQQGIRIEETGEGWIVGNLVYDVVQRGVALEKNGDPLHIIGNIFHDVEMGIDQFWRESFTVYVHDNVFSMVRGRVLSIESNEVAARSRLTHNLFWNGGSAMMMRWGRDRPSVSGASDVDALAEASDNVVADPGFMDPASGDFHVGSESPLVNAGTSSEVYDAFMTTYGIDISVDGDRNPRPVGDWDIGPYEQ